MAVPYYSKRLLRLRDRSRRRRRRGGRGAAIASTANAANTSTAYAAGVATGSANTTAAYQAGALPPRRQHRQLVGWRELRRAAGRAMAVNKNGTTYYLSGQHLVPAGPFGANGVHYGRSCALTERPWRVHPLVRISKAANRGAWSVADVQRRFHRRRRWCAGATSFTAAFAQATTGHEADLPAPRPYLDPLDPPEIQRLKMNTPVRPRTAGMLVSTVAAAALLAACNKPADTITQAAKTDAAASVPAPSVPAPSIAETKAIMEEAYIYGFPMVAAYKAMVEFNIDKSSSQYKTGFNQIWNDGQTFTPKDTAIPTPNADTPYSMVQADLRAEPIVLCVPAIEKNRYYSVMLADLYTFNYGYIGSRATGNDAGLLPGGRPALVRARSPRHRQVFRSETDFSFIIYRTQLFNPADIDNVKKIQAGYTVQTLSAFLKQPAPPAAPCDRLPKFVGDDPFRPSSPRSRLPAAVRAGHRPGGGGTAARQARQHRHRPGQEVRLQDLSLEHKAAWAWPSREGFEKIDKPLDKIGKGHQRLAGRFYVGDREFFNGDWLLRAAAARPASTATMRWRRCIR